MRAECRGTLGSRFVERGGSGQFGRCLHRGGRDDGLRTSEPARELYLDCPDDPADWVTELQEPIE